MIAVALALVAQWGCGRGDGGARRAGSAGTAAVDSARRAAASDTRHPTPYTRTILFLGTSLTAGLGLEPGEAYPALIQRRLDSLRLPWRAMNAGVSGDTSAGAVRRLDWLLKDPPAVLVLETGANDGLRGLDLDSTRANLDTIVARTRRADPGVVIVLAGMEVPPNLGARYAAGFRALFPSLARREGLALIPFLLAGVWGVDSLNQADGIHPTAAGDRIVAENVWRVLGPLVDGRGDARTHRRTAGDR